MYIVFTYITHKNVRTVADIHCVLVTNENEHRKKYIKNNRVYKHKNKHIREPHTYDSVPLCLYVVLFNHIYDVFLCESFFFSTSPLFETNERKRNCDFSRFSAGRFSSPPEPVRGGFFEASRYASYLQFRTSIELDAMPGNSDAIFVRFQVASSGSRYFN